MFKGDFDLTTAVFGPEGWTWQGVFINEGGTVLWKSGRYLYLDEQRAWFTEFLGTEGGIAIHYGLNDRGDVL